MSSPAAAMFRESRVRFWTKFEFSIADTDDQKNVLNQINIKQNMLRVKVKRFELYQGVFVL